jgi:hypothetical protein
MIAELREIQDQLAEILATQSNTPVVSIDERQQIVDCNFGFLKMFSLVHKPRGSALDDFLMAGADGLNFVPGDQELTCNPKSGVHGILIVHRLPHQSGLLLWCERLQTTNNQVVEQMAVLNNEFIAMQRELSKKNQLLKRMQHDLEEKVLQLEAALSQVKRLEGIIPICMYCKSIRDNEELWHNVERYIADHSDAEFSHGICPDCFENKFGLPDKTVTTPT